MKGYLFRFKNIQGIRYELFVPDVGVLLPRLGKVIRCEGYREKMQNILKEIKKSGDNTFGVYKLLGEKEVPEFLIEGFVEQVESRDISQEMVKEFGSKLEKYIGVPDLPLCD